ncbi:hypothetical protein RB2654_15065 [Rhodobacterales bacterium HTCC2654]|uniref:Uncharacterized protein n=1 Tax=Maritimibacter alkaliphilus HTCC2654 TaxID=314271 RepID=A3VH62_9RHOB|nr:hypothetical protein RB2654_15065 [Rhodobacterales bacterium HTCC2654] [Maritimibacter alkaliphilus HTCC2654]
MAACERCRAATASRGSGANRCWCCYRSGRASLGSTCGSKPSSTISRLSERTMTSWSAATA